MSKKVLIIDDDLDLCALLGRFLTKNGYEIEMAHSGAKGIAKFAEKKFDAVICDYRLVLQIAINNVIASVDPKTQETTQKEEPPGSWQNRIFT